MKHEDITNVRIQYKQAEAGPARCMAPETPSGHLTIVALNPVLSAGGGVLWMSTVQENDGTH